jgi:hypothetical protein
VDVDGDDVLVYIYFVLFCRPYVGYMNQRVKWGCKDPNGGNQGFGGLKV